MFNRRVFQQQFDAYERVAGTREQNSLATREQNSLATRETLVSIEGIVKQIAEKETRSSLYDLGEMVYEKQMQTYTTIDNTSVLFRVKELYGAKVLHAKTPETDDWTFITKFDCN
jgi:hypothetical protein